MSIGCNCGAGVLGLIGCRSLSLSLALPAYFTNNNMPRSCRGRVQVLGTRLVHEPRSCRGRVEWNYLAVYLPSVNVSVLALSNWGPLVVDRLLLLLLLLLSLLKPAAQAQEGKIKLFINCFRNPTTPAPRKTDENITQGSNQRLTAPLNPSSVPV